MDDDTGGAGYDRRDDLREQELSDDLHCDSDQTESVFVAPIRTIGATFSGQTCRVGPPTWGQIGMWLMHKRLISRTETLNLQVSFQFSENVSLDTIVCGVIALVCRHEALRTIFEEIDHSRFRTETLGDGEFEARIYTARESPLPTDVFVEKVLTVERRHSFDLQREVPVRLTVIELPSGEHCASLVVSHMAADGFSAGVLTRDLEEIIGGRESPVTDQRASVETRTRLQPFEIATGENSATGEAENRRSLGYWKKVLKCSPRTVFPWGRGIDSSRLEMRMVLNSRAVLLAIFELASRYEARMPSVALAAISTVLAGVSGDPRVMYQVVCSNRVSGGIRNSVGCIAQGGLFFLDTDSQTFSELIVRTGRAELMAYGSARYDSVQRNVVVNEIGLERGVRFDLHTIVSDALLADRRLGADQRHDLYAMDEALSETRIESSISGVVASERFFLHMSYRDGMAQLIVKADPATFTEQLVSAILQGIESVLVAACREDRSPSELARDAGIISPERGEQWVQTDAGWVDLSAVAEIVERAGPTKVISVRHSEEEGIVACLDPSGTQINEGALRGRVMNLLAEYPSASAPERYVFEAPSLDLA
ncbi:condensation domain-containing protein [Streptomyces sp. NPDC001401]|uniref:condensation domain-containing protein n=1 Tax=Streptomyces sp. NPDC001401 TaxID=3364570 RepID=UPI0036AB962E